MIKSTIKKIDNLVFGGLVLKIYNEYYEAKNIKALKASLDYRFITNYKKNNSDFLSLLCDKYGSDKGEIKKTGHPYTEPSHTYTDFYSRLFSHCRLNVRKVFECGLGTNNPDIPCGMGIDGKPGASLRVWREYFPNAQVVGADIDKDVLFKEERIKTFYVDQTDPKAIGKFWNEVGFGDFDFMVDDGLHTFEAGVCLFENSILKLSKQGIYIIEDVNLADLLKYQHYFDNKKYQVDYVNLLRPDMSITNNNLVVIRQD